MKPPFALLQVKRRWRWAARDTRAALRPSTPRRSPGRAGRGMRDQPRRSSSSRCLGDAAHRRGEVAGAPVHVGLPAHAARGLESLPAFQHVGSESAPGLLKRLDGGRGPETGSENAWRLRIGPQARLLSPRAAGSEEAGDRDREQKRRARRTTEHLSFLIVLTNAVPLAKRSKRAPHAITAILYFKGPSPIVSPFSWRRGRRQFMEDGCVLESYSSMSSA